MCIEKQIKQFGYKLLICIKIIINPDQVFLVSFIRGMGLSIFSHNRKS